MDDLSSLAHADQDAIGVTLTSLLTGFRERDADKLVNVYSAELPKGLNLSSAGVLSGTPN
jgi:hypothetical protein